MLLLRRALLLGLLMVSMLAPQASASGSKSAPLNAGHYGGVGPGFVAVLDAGPSRTLLRFWFETQVDGTVVSSSFELHALMTANTYGIKKGNLSCGTAIVTGSKTMLTIRYGSTTLRVSPSDNATIESAISHLAKNAKYARLNGRDSGRNTLLYDPIVPKCSP